MHFTFSSFGLRFLFSALLVFATYNPEGYSYFDWVKAVFPSITIEQAFVGVLLLIGWVIYIRATLRSLGIIGLILAFAFFGEKGFDEFDIHRGAPYASWNANRIIEYYISNKFV